MTTNIGKQSNFQIKTKLSFDMQTGHTSSHDVVSQASKKHTDHAHRARCTQYWKPGHVSKSRHHLVTQKSLFVLGKKRNADKEIKFLPAGKPYTYGIKRMLSTVEKRQRLPNQCTKTENRILEKEKFIRKYG